MLVARAESKPPRALYSWPCRYFSHRSAPRARFSWPSPEPDADGAGKVGAIYTLTENPGRNLALWKPAQTSRDIRRGVGRERTEPRVQDIVRAAGETMGIIKYSAWMVCRARGCRRERDPEKGRAGKGVKEQCHLHINCPPKITLTFNFPLPGFATYLYLPSSRRLNWRNISVRPDCT